MAAEVLVQHSSSTPPSYFTNSPNRTTPPSTHTGEFSSRLAATYQVSQSLKFLPTSNDASRQPHSEPSSAPSSPYLNTLDFSRRASCMSTPSSNLSLSDHFDQQAQNEICFPDYDNDVASRDAKGFFLGSVEDPLRPPPTPESATPSDFEDLSETSRQDTQLHNPTVIGETIEASPSAQSARSASAHFSLLEPETLGGDDLAMQLEPTRQVDYLSYAWKEEDIWSSWRYLVARRASLNNSARLENAAWRTWTKFKYGLQTVSPEALNWMKDHDVTWLYGPLLSGHFHHFRTGNTPPANQFSRSNSFAHKKPILKKRSLSERMLQRSISSSTLMKQATDAVRAQLPDKLRTRPKLSLRHPSELTCSPESETPQTASSDLSTSSSGLQTPSVKRHIHFNNKVEQCIAINKHNDDRQPSYFDFALHSSRSDLDFSSDGEDEDGHDDGLLTMPVIAHISRPCTPRNSFSSHASHLENRTIAMLPATTLNYRSDTPEPANRSAPPARASPNISPSPSVQTLRPSAPSTNFLIDDDDEADHDWQPHGSQYSKDTFTFGGLALQNDEDDDIDGEIREGLRRTPSGMFMPYDDAADDPNGLLYKDGILGRMVDTVNTAKDIAHVIWNVGWRR